MVAKNTEFDDIRPYYDEEVVPVIEALLQDDEFKRVVQGYIFPGIDWNNFSSLLKGIRNRYEFQHGIIKEAVHDIMSKTSDSVDAGGFENLENREPHIYMSNHRDIVLDASLIAIMLSDHGYDTMEIAIGDNLLLQPWIEDIVRLNKSFIVKRGISFKEQLLASTQLSKYIHYTITEKKESLWIAQREGRAKNSDDRTQDSILKMLSMGGEKEFLPSIKELNVLPVSLSYEYDPCDFLKAKEFQQRRDNPDFKKSQKDDLISMETGLFGYKGRVYFHFGKSINDSLNKLDGNLPKNELASTIAKIIDKEIFLNYRFYPINYISYDRLWGGDTFKSYYTQEDIDKVNDYLNTQLDKIELEGKDLPFLQERIYEMYANPVRNYLSVKS